MAGVFMAAAKKAASLGMQAVGNRFMSSGRSGKTTIHRLIEEHGTVLLPGVHDAFAACCVQKTGFKADFVSGFGVSASHLGKPDFGLLTTTEMAEVARRVCAAAPQVGFIVDADTGGGGALNVQRVVKDLIAAGAKGVFLEDQLWPKK